MRHTPAIIAAVVAAGPALLLAHPGDRHQHGHEPSKHGHNHEMQPGIFPVDPGEPTVIGTRPRHGFAVYENLQTTGFRYTLPNDVMIADDLHMTHAGDMIAFTFLYSGSSLFCAGFWSGNATVRFYENNASNTLLPSSSTLIATFNVPVEGTGSASYMRHFDLAAPVTLPSSIWMGISFDFGVIGGSGAMTAAANPAIGSSLDAHFTGSGGFATNPHSFAYANYGFAVYIPAPGAGMLLVLAAAGARRRRSEVPRR